MPNTSSGRPAKATQPPTTTGIPPGRPHGKAAASRVRQQESVQVALPMIGPVTLPRPQDMAYYVGVATLVALELLEWPAAVALAAGHALLNQHHNQALEEFGEALEEA